MKGKVQIEDVISAIQLLQKYDAEVQPLAFDERQLQSTCDEVSLEGVEYVVMRVDECDCSKDGIFGCEFLEVVME